MRILVYATAIGALFAVSAFAQDVHVLATNKTLTMEQEMNRAADAGFKFADVMGGDTSFGGSEVAVVMVRSRDAKAAFQYRLLATNKTSTMQKEMQEAGDAVSNTVARRFSRVRSLEVKS